MTTKQIALFLIVALVLPAIAGCSLAVDAIRSGLTPGPSACDFAPGQATQEQVEATWGSPDGWTRESGGQISLRYKKGFATATARFNPQHILEAMACERKG